MAELASIFNLQRRKIEASLFKVTISIESGWGLAHFWKLVNDAFVSLEFCGFIY